MTAEYRGCTAAAAMSADFCHIVTLLAVLLLRSRSSTEPRKPGQERYSSFACVVYACCSCAAVPSLICVVETRATGPVIGCGGGGGCLR